MRLTANLSPAATLARSVWSIPMYLLVASLPAAQAATLSVKVVDPAGQLLPCRAWVTAGGQRLFEPQAPASCTPYHRDRSFSCDGEFSITVPDGPVVVHVERGKEYLAVDHEVRVAAGPAQQETIILRRWLDMPGEGWFSGDLHVHLGVDNPQVLRQLALADDVHLTPVFTYWLRGTEPGWQSQWPDWGSDGVEPIDANHLITRSNIEIERIDGKAAQGATVGASFLYQLVRPVTTSHFGEHFPTDAALCLAARGHSPQVVIDTDKPSWAETVVGAALGVYDTVQVCHNHYHRDQTIPGSHGMIGPLTATESNALEGDGLFHRTNDLYYRFLNCGFRLGVSGGSAIGVMPVPMGYNRVYAQVEGPLSPQAFWRAVQQGRTFATSGPLLTMTVEGQPLGSVLHRTRAEAKPLNVQLRLRSAERLESLQLVQDGSVVQELDLSGRSLSTGQTLHVLETWQVTPERSGWVAGRALFRASDGRLRQAHTSPIYVIIDEKPIGRAADAEYMLSWLDRLEEVAEDERRFKTPLDRARLLEVYRRARKVYEGIAGS